MNKRKIMDCTLREYFSYLPFCSSDSIRRLFELLCSIGIDYVECGHVRDRELCETGLMLEDIHQFDELYKHNSRTKCVVLMDLGRFDISRLQHYAGGVISGIRLCFKKDEIRLVPRVAEQIKNKGYELYIQHADYCGYLSEDTSVFLSEVNQLCPCSYSIVDTFGTMNPNDLSDAVALVNSKLDSSITMGFHGHNNKMLANALNIQFIEDSRIRERDIVVDATFMGLGRGAGNANTEIICNYLGTYDFTEVVTCADFISDYLQLDYNKRQFAYLLTGLFDAHTFIADKLLKRFDSLSFLFDILKISKERERKCYDDEILSMLISRYEGSDKHE